MRLLPFCMCIVRYIGEFIEATGIVGIGRRYRVSWQVHRDPGTGGRRSCF